VNARASPALALAVLIVMVIQPMGQAQEEGFLLVGYGGEKFLPFLDGARYRFVVGESLVLKAIGSDISVILTTSKDEEHVFRIGAGDSLEVRRFGPGDVGLMSLAVVGGGKAVIEVLSVEESALGWIEFQPVGTVSNGSGTQEVLEARIVGSTLSGFELRGEEGEGRRIFVRPNSTLQLQIPANALNAKVTLLSQDFIELSGYTGQLHLVYRVEPVVAEYMFNVTGTGQLVRVVDVHIPALGEVGENGLVPLRYGILLMSLVYTARSGGRFEQNFEVMVSPIMDEPPPMSSTVTITLEELLRSGLEVVTADLSTGRFEHRVVRVPDYRVIVYDTYFGSWVEDYSISFTGYVSLRNGTESIIIPSTVSISEEEYPSRIAIRPSFTVYSVDISDSIGPVTLEAGRTVTIYVEGRLVDVEVRHAAGFLIQDSSIYVNDTFRGVGGSLSLRLPAGIYNFSAATPFGKVFSAADVRDVRRVVLVVRGYTAETLALITVFLIQLSIFAMYSWRWLKSRRLRGIWGSSGENQAKK